MLSDTLKKIQPLNQEAMQKQSAYMDSLVKPIGSLGELETLSIRLSGITGLTDTALSLPQKALIVMCGDHGVCEEGIASAPQIVTYIQSENIALGTSGAGAIARQFGGTVIAVDVGIDSPNRSPHLVDRRIANGTDNIAKGPAMTKEQAVLAIEVGIASAENAIDAGAQVLAIGEMGIGNTTPSTALLCAMTGASPEEVTGVGANFPKEKLPHKIAVIERALEVNAQSGKSPIERLAALGGYEIAGMTGVILGAAARNVPVVVDGYISTISALLASEMHPHVRDYLIASHASHETGAALATKTLDILPYLRMDMRLGEGSGALLAFPLIDAACAISAYMTTFDSSGIASV